MLLRVQGDPTRGVSKNPVILRRFHEMFVRALPFLETAGPVIDTDVVQEEVVGRLLAALHDSPALG